jgi:hypothetical protein
MKDFEDFFDISDIEHLKAWNVFKETGMFPSTFYKNMPIDFIVTEKIRRSIEQKMVDEYIKMKIILNMCEDVK